MRRLSLLVDGDRWRVAKALSDKADHINWAEVLEQVCTLTVRTFRKGQPILRLRDVEASASLPYLIERLLPEGDTGIVFGDGEAGKSMFALFVAVAFAGGITLPCGLRPVHHGNVLYLDWESTDPSEHKRRMRRVCEGAGIQEPEGIYYRQCFRPIHEEAEALAVQVVQHDIGLIIVDSLAPACGGDPSVAADAVRTMNALRQLGATRLAIGHVNRIDREKPAANQTTFGSIFWRNMTRSMWQLTAESDQLIDDHARFALHQRKSNNAKRDRWPIGLRYEFDGDTGPIRMFADEIDHLDSRAGGASMTETLRRAMLDGAKDLDELGDIIDREPNQVRAIVAKMRDVVNLNKGAGGKGNKGLYGIVANGSAPGDVPKCHRCGAAMSAWDDDARPVCEAHMAKP
jgi:hypothetical protein